MAGGLVAEVKYKGSSDSLRESDYQAEQIDVLNELYRVTKPGGYIFYNHKLRWLKGTMIHPMEWIAKSKWDIRQEIIWDRGIAANIRGWRFWQIEERVYWMQKGIQVGEEILSKHAKMSSIWKIRPESRFPEHPAPFPLEFPTRCIYCMFDNANGLNVLDPYCGTGTTLVAAKILGHNYVGIDICPDYQSLFQNRLTDLTEVRIVEDEKRLHVVEKSYAERKKLKLSES